MLLSRMNIVICIISFCILRVTVNSWVLVSQHVEDSANQHEGYCYTDNVGALEKGEKRKMKSMCAEAFCGENKDIYISGCGVYKVEPPCYTVLGNLSKPYPQCCVEFICPEGDEWKEKLNTWYNSIQQN